MTYAFGKTSLERMKGLHPKLIAVVHGALAILNEWDAAGVATTDMMVLPDSVRTLERQKQLYAKGRTAPGPKVTWTLESKHRIQADGFSHAVDLCPFPVDWEGPVRFPKFDLISRAMFASAAKLNTPIRWGADWDRDGNPRERGETDSPHFELWGV